MSKSRTTVLLTGFGPFPAQPVNVTMKLVPQVTAEAQRLFPDIRFKAAILPTEWISAPRVLGELIDAHDPDVAVHFGISSRARGFEIEARGRNVCGDTEDASGCKPAAALINDVGPEHLATNLPDRKSVV